MPALSPSVLAWLRCFDAAARCGSFTRAAGELHVSQGAVSQQVKKLEDWLGHPLLLRTAGGLVPTAAGERLAPAARQSFAGLEAAVGRLRGAGPGEPVQVSCSPSFAMLWLTLRLGDFHRTHPQVALRIVGESATADPARLAREGIAASVRFVAEEDADAAHVPLFDEWLVPVATPAFLAAHPQLRDARALQGRHLLHAADPGEGDGPTQEWALWLAAAGVELPPAEWRQGPQFNLSQLAVQAALGSQGIAMGRAALVLGYLAQGRLVAPFARRVRRAGAYRCMAPAPHPATATFLAWLVAQAAGFARQRDALFEREGICAG